MSQGSFYFRDNTAFKGGSPQAVYEELWERGRVQRLRQRAIVAGILLVLGVRFLNPWWGILLAAVGAGLDMAFQWWRRAMHTVWLHGRRGERRTGRILRLALVPRGHRILNGRSVPGYGNLDQLVIGPSGIWAVGSGAWEPGAEFAAHGGKLFVGRNEGIPEVARLREAASTVGRLMAERLGHDGQVVVTPVLAVYGGKLRGGRMESGGVRMARSYRLPGLFKPAAGRISPEEVELLTQAAIHALPIGDHTMAAR